MVKCNYVYGLFIKLVHIAILLQDTSRRVISTCIIGVTLMFHTRAFRIMLYKFFLCITCIALTLGLQSESAFKHFLCDNLL